MKNSEKSTQSSTEFRFDVGTKVPTEDATTGLKTKKRSAGINTKFKFKVGDKFPETIYTYHVLEKDGGNAFVSVIAKPTRTISGYAIATFYNDESGNEKIQIPEILTKGAGKPPFYQTPNLTKEEATEAWTKFVADKTAKRAQDALSIKSLKEQLVISICRDNMKAEGDKRLKELHMKLSNMVNNCRNWDSVMNDPEILKVVTELNLTFLILRKIKVDVVSMANLSKLGFNDFGDLKKEALKLSKSAK